MNILCIFAKPPIPGKTKKRLAASIGSFAAAELSQIMLNYILKESRASSADQIFLYIPIDCTRSDFVEIDCREVTVQHQIGCDLGEKMANVFKSNCLNNQKVLLIGSDCISLTAEYINEAFNALNTHDIVIQPATDGGYVLIGQNKCNAKVFEGPKWGQSTVFADTIQIIKELNASYFLLPIAFDIDVKEDMIKLHSVVEKTNNPEIKKWLQKYSY